MKRLALEHVTDFGDFTQGRDLSEFLKQNHSNVHRKNCLSDIRISPDGQHIHAILRTPKTGLMTFDKYQRFQLIQSQKPLELGLTRTAPVSDVVYLDCSSRDGGGSAVLTVVFENGKAEFWKYWERRGGWHFLQASDLCNSPTAKVVSVCASAGFIVWCEERPPSESSSVVNATRNSLRYCICKRAYEVEEGGVCLGGVKITLHNNPCYRVIASGDSVYLVPDVKDNSLNTISKVFLSWSPEHGTVTVNSACRGAILRKPSLMCKESDFKKLMVDCIGMLSVISPPEIWAFAPSGCGGLLLFLSSGWVALLQKDGVLRQVYKLADDCSAIGGSVAHTSMAVYGDVLALAAERTLYLVDVRCGLELQRIPLKREGVLFVNHGDRGVPYLLSEAGLFVVREGDGPVSRSRPSGQPERLQPGALLMEAIFEEACKYYQQRSLSGNQLTVEKLKSGGMFQAPIALSSILGDYLSGRRVGEQGQEAGGHAKLLSSLDTELKSLVALEELKASVVGASEKDLEGHCESLVHKEVGRLLGSEVDRESVLYLNTIFTAFPSQAWRALQAVLQLGANGDGSLYSRTPPEVWKVVLSPVPAPAQCPGAGRQRDHTSAPANMAVPVFELVCRLVFRFQPSWLPRFVELAQQQQQAGASSPWGYGAKESPESAPLYKRALSALPEGSEFRDLEVELLLGSQRPNAIMQALRILIDLQQWGRVTQVAERFCRQSPLLNKEIFTALLCEVSQHRDLDSYLDLLWTLCPDDLTVTSILNIVLKSLPSPTPDASPFQARGGQLTIGLLKPLLSRVLQRETKPSQRYADILQSPSFPPPTPPRQARGIPRAMTDPAVAHMDCKQRTGSGTRVTSPSHLL
ncbi:Hermansky-Pudlak syndrome 6 protein [Megalops cyprinoides]|uniref:Hermansky-Pudlak syndrome 6 protein n=1 Tax=Megalops cyprinoides TaxID=118141 RepID=UPI00186486C6|nr:Hermansky-Pudlak syndrome 6 protein [Megalops cyprinoides]